MIITLPIERDGLETIFAAPDQCRGVLAAKIWAQRPAFLAVECLQSGIQCAYAGNSIRKAVLRAGYIADALCELLPETFIRKIPSHPIAPLHHKRQRGRPLISLTVGGDGLCCRLLGSGLEWLCRVALDLLRTAELIRACQLVEVRLQARRLLLQLLKCRQGRGTAAGAFLRRRRRSDLIQSALCSRFIAPELSLIALDLIQLLCDVLDPLVDLPLQRL